MCERILAQGLHWSCENTSFTIPLFSHAEPEMIFNSIVNTVHMGEWIRLLFNLT